MDAEAEKCASASLADDECIDAWRRECAPCLSNASTLRFRAASMASRESSEILLPASSILIMVVLFVMASARARPPWDPMLFQRRSTSFSDTLFARAVARMAAPEGPILLLRRSIRDKDALCSMLPAMI